MPMRSSTSATVATTSTTAGKECINEQKGGGAQRSAYLWLAMFILLLNGSWAVYHYQYESLPLPVSAEQAGKRGFSEVSAMAHVKYLAKLGPHPVGSDALDTALQYVLAAAENIKQTAHWEVDVQVDLFHAITGANRLVSGLFKGKTLVYSDLKHVVLRILPKYLPEAAEHVILVSSHIDTVFSAEGAGDCSSCVGVMLELARGISQWAHGFKNGVIFLFNTGEEEGLDGAHSFITQHPWNDTICFMVDLEAMGIGGKSGIFQSTTDPWAIETYAMVAKYPSGQIVAQDLFNSGVIKSATDFQVYKEVAGLPGLDFAYVDYSAVYHTKGMHMVVYSQRLASMLYNSVILQALILWTGSLFVGGYSSVITFGVSCLNIVLMWIFSLSFSVLVAFVIPLICSSPVPYIANPWLVVGLFGSPALLGALAGQHWGFLFLQKCICRTYSTRMPNLSPNLQENVTKWEAERWLFKCGFIQWMVLLITGNFYKVGSSYLALIWLVSPAFAYGLMEATLSPVRLPRQLKIATLIVGLALPVLVSAGIIIQFVGTITGTLVRFDRNPGGTPEWVGNLAVAIFITAVVCLTLTYMLSYIHLSGAKRPVVISVCVLFGLSLAAVSTGMIPAFTDDVSRSVNVVHVVETGGKYLESQGPLSYISLFSTTPGKLTNEVENLKDEEFTCGTNKHIDFVGFIVKYGCLSFKDTGDGWSKSDTPTLHVESDTAAGDRQTRVLIDTKHSTRWTAAINTKEIRDFTFEANGVEVVPLGGKTEVDGWHTIQFAGGKNSPTKIHLNLVWATNTSYHMREGYVEGSDLLLKLRTDVNKVTPKAARVLEKLPRWCSLFGKSSSPYTLAFLTSLPVNF